MKLLITGCGRGGTYYAFKVMRELGADFGHESIYPQGCASWFCAANDKEVLHLWKKGEFEAVDVKDFEVVVHQTRHPLKTIRSWLPLDQVASPAQIDFIEKYTSCRKEMPPIEFAARYWYDWNRMCEKVAGLTYRVENIEEILMTLCFAVGVKYDPEVLKRVPRDTNATTFTLPPPVSWLDLYDYDFELADKIKKLSEKYGYEI